MAAPDKLSGLDKCSRPPLWVVPAQAAGDRCGSGALRDARLRLTQRYQVFEAALSLGRAEQRLVGRIGGVRLRTAGGFDAVPEGGRLRVAQPGTTFLHCAG